MNDAASPLDRISLIAERRERPLDFALLLSLAPGAPDDQALVAGAASAYRTFPRSCAHLEGGRWSAAEPPTPRIERYPSAPELRARVETAIEQPIDPRCGAGVEVVIYKGPAGTSLLVRCHHAAADGASLLWWIDHQLRVASGGQPRTGEGHATGALALQQHPAPQRKNRFAHRGSSRNLWRRRPEPSRTRRFTNLIIDREAWRERLGPRAARGFSYNDLLAAATLAAMRAFQRAHHAPTDRLSLWFPIDVRLQPFTGFGNGASRVRLYDRAPAEASLSDLAFLVREELLASRADGEWHVPQEHPLLDLPDWIVRAYLRRPWVDMGTLPFSHGERAAPDPSEQLLQGVIGVTSIGTLDRRHALGITGLTLGPRTELTLTWDPALLDESDVSFFGELYAQALKNAEGTLPPCAG